MENLNYLLKTGLGKVPESPNKLDPVTYCCHGLTSYFEELRSQMRNVLEAIWTALISCLPTLLRLQSFLSHLFNLFRIGHSPEKLEYNATLFNIFYIF